MASWKQKRRPALEWPLSDLPVAGMAPQRIPRVQPEGPECPKLHVQLRFQRQLPHGPRQLEFATRIWKHRGQYVSGDQFLRQFVLWSLRNVSGQFMAGEPFRCK